MHYLKLILCLIIMFFCPFAAESDYAETKDSAAQAKTYISASPGSQLTAININCTAYDLSYASCEKHESEPAYGITAAGINLRGKSHREAMVIAVDPAKIPLGSKILIVFPEPKYQKYNGIYTAGDIGGAISGNRIDIFIPDHKEALAFGRTSAKAYVL